MQTQPPIKRALISVSNKKGIVEFAVQLHSRNIEILASGGSARLLKTHHIPVTEIADYTGFPEILDGRVKTLHPKIHAGLLARRGIDDDTLQQHAINPIDLLVVNLYPFRETIQNPSVSLSTALENVDIGGPTLLRAAAKNYQHVTAVVDPDDYELVLQALQQHNAVPLELRLQLAQKVFAHTALYDTIIAHYLESHTTKETVLFPEIYHPAFKLQKILRYGENPHQLAAYYVDHPSKGTLANAVLLQGKPLSYNNLIDADCALHLVQALETHRAACVIVKHATPCGVAQAENAIKAYKNAYRCDSESAFGGIIAINHPLTEALASLILQQPFVEVLLAPAVLPDAQTRLHTKPNIRVLQYFPSTNKNAPLALHSISVGLLLQQPDTFSSSMQAMRVVTKRQPTTEEWRDLCFAWRVVKFVKSNAIVFAKNEMTLGIGGGQTSRFFAAKIAVLRAEFAELSLQQTAMASDAFFPFSDSIEFAAQHNIRAIVQPGGSKRDSEVIAAANAADIAMVFTGIRHFRH